MRQPNYYDAKDKELVARGLDPRSLFPRCDFCAKKNDPGTTQLGRWWGHVSCVTHPENLSLASVKLPAVDYRDVRDRVRPRFMVMAKLQQLKAWSRDRLRQFRIDATGESLQELE